MAKWTHRVTYAEMGCSLNLREIAEAKYDIEYHKAPFKRLLWRHRKIGYTCMLYTNGKTICHGGKHQLRKYARLLEKNELSDTD